MDWKPLPKRERKSKKNNNNNGTMDIDNACEITNSEENAKQVDENIRVRSKRKLAVATLEDTDGVAGEFYECNTISIFIIIILI